jgi:threonine/homoserine/homoserine lactone efflux protein
MLTLGLLFVLLSATTDSGWVMAAAPAGLWLKRHPVVAARQRYVSGGALIGLGVVTAVTGGRHK